MRIALMLAVVMVSVPAPFASRQPDDLVGTWKLVGASASAGGKLNNAPYGAQPTGMLIYTSQGTMSAIVSYSGRALLSADRVAAPLEERAAAFETFFAYAGRYTLTRDTVVHHVDVASVPNWVNTDLIRVVERDRNRLTLRTPPLVVGGELRTSELVWERLPANRP